MVVDVITETLIALPCEQVAAFAADPSNAPLWYANIKSVTWQTAPPVDVGSRMDFVARFLGRTLAYTYEIVDYEPDRRCREAKVSSGCFSMNGRIGPSLENRGVNRASSGSATSGWSRP